MRIWHRLKKQWDIWLFLVCFFCLSTVVAFGYGFYVVQCRTPLYYKIWSACDAAVSKYGLWLSSVVYSKKYKKYPLLWNPTSESVSGVVLNKGDKTYPGYTLYSDCTSSAYLVDMQGNVVHRWHKPFSDVWPQPKHVEPWWGAPPEEMIHWFKTRLFPNGDLLAIYHGAFTPYGAGLIKIDAQSNLIWKADINAHHDFDIAGNGDIYVLTQKYNNDGGKSCIDDYLTILSPNGRVVKNISIYEALRNSPYASVLPDRYGDYLHTNSIEILSAGKAVGFPFLKAGDILLSHRALGCFSVIDGATFNVKWVLSGLADAVHDADFLENGRIAFFDNVAYRHNNNYSSQIVEWDCIRHEQGWSFSYVDYLHGAADAAVVSDPFLSVNGGAQQKLPNGNYLITESEGGTLLEVTADKQVVWKYVSPSFDGESIGAIFWAERYPAHLLPFLSSSPQ